MAVIIPKDLGKGGSGIGFIGRLTKLGKTLSCLKDILVSGFLVDFTQAKTKLDQLLARLDSEGGLTHNYATGEKAVGSIVCVTTANIANGGTDHFHIGDGVHHMLEFYYDKNTSRAAGAYEVEITLAGGEDADAVRDLTAAAIAAQKAAGKLDITETHLVGATVALSCDRADLAGNVTIIESVANGGYSATGMVGGLDPLGLTPVTEAE
jgi:6-pyruvoyl-tetrahydropterin synthase